MQDNIVSFPNAENRFYRVVEKLEALAALHPHLATDARGIVRDLEGFVVAIDRQLEGAYVAMTNSRTSETRAVAWSEAVRQVCAPDTMRAVQQTYERLVTAI